ncbi:membrane protein insertase YidC [Buchnera aphidicola]|uniref:membrane protein insertase YidC n=1 Tax=Buchnera aphidicola TaxID=9 RepID=UPI003BEF076C
MSSQRNFFIFAFLFVSFLLWQAWQNQLILNNQNNKKNDSSSYLINKNKKKNYIFIKNDVMNLMINMYGGDIEEASLLAYKEKLYTSKPFKLLETTSNFIYQAQSGLSGKDGIDHLDNNERPLYFSKKRIFELSYDDDTISVPITYIGKNGIVYIKRFILKSGEYDVKVEYDIYNSTNKKLELNMFGQLKQTMHVPKTRNAYSGNFVLQTFRGAAYSSINEKYKKYKFDTIAKNENLHVITQNGWVAMLQQYFSTAWIPNSFYKNTLYTSYLEDGTVSIGYKSSSINILAHSKKTIGSTVWIGPEIQNKMALVAPNLDLTVDYGWLWFLSQPLFNLLSFLYKIIGNWGFSIIFITFIMRAITYPLTKAQYISVSKMRILQPKINILKERFKNDKKRLSQEVMLLYQKEKINPLSGFLPVLIQMPIFLALYYMLMSSIELRHAPFILWIKDLSSEDPYYILPILMGFTMFFIHKMSSDNISDPLQQKIMNFMPVIFTVFFLWFPSGLVLYYIVSNIVTIIQQRFILSNLDKKNKKENK